MACRGGPTDPLASIASRVTQTSREVLYVAFISHSKKRSTVDVKNILDQLMSNGNLSRLDAFAPQRSEDHGVDVQTRSEQLEYFVKKPQDSAKNTIRFR